MKKAKKFLYPPRWVRYTVPSVSFGALWYLFATENTERVLAYPLIFYISGVMAVVNQWLKADCSDSVEQIIALIQKCIPKAEREV